MKIFIFLLVALALFGLLLLIYKKLFSHAENVKRVLKEDPKAQKIYDMKKNHELEEDKSLTLEEKIKLSWQFLTNITEKIINSFSKSDQEKVHEAGAKLNEYGMKYQHNVEQELKQKSGKIKSIATQKDKEQTKGITR